MNSIDEIKLLLNKNKQRFGQELKQSKEAIFLIKKATHTQLSEEERTLYIWSWQSILERYINENRLGQSSFFHTRKTVLKINQQYSLINIEIMWI